MEAAQVPVAQVFIDQKNEMYIESPVAFKPIGLFYIGGRNNTYAYTIISLILILSILFLSSCSLASIRKEIENGSSDEAKAKARLEQVIETIKNKDKGAKNLCFQKRR